MTATDEQRARVAEYITDDLRYRGRTREAEAFEAVLADSESGYTSDDSLTMIAWALRLPLLWARLRQLDATPLTEVRRIQTLIAEGERALGIQPPGGES